MHWTWFRYTALLGLLAAAIAQAFADDTPAVSAELNGLRLEFSAKTGGLQRMTFPATGTMLEAGDDAGLLDLAYPVQEFLPLRLATRFSEAQFERQPDGISIVWQRLGPSRTRHATLPAGHVQARVTFRAAEDRRSVIVTCRIDNESSGTIPQILFPDLHGLRPFAGKEQTILQFANGTAKPFAGPARTFDPNPVSWVTDIPFWVQQGWHAYPCVGLYAANALRWIDLGSYQGGLSIFQKRWGDALIPTIYTQRTEADPEPVRMMWENRITIAPGQSWTSDEFWLTPHAGGWAKGIEVYRDYVQKVNPPREMPKHVRDGLGFMTIMMSLEAESDPEHAVFRFSDLPRVARDAHEHGLSELVPWLWSRYFRIPMEVDERLGTTEEFVEAVKTCRDLGVNVSPFVDVKIVPKSLARRYGTPADARGFQGSSLIYHWDLVPHIDAYYMEPAFVKQAPPGYPGPLYDVVLLYPDREDSRCNVTNDLWQQDAVATFKTWIDRGVPSFSWDLFHSVIMPSGKRSVVVEVAEQIRKLARARDPQSVFSGECTSSAEYDSPVLDYTWNWARTLDSGPVMNVMRTPRQNYNVESSILELKSGFCTGQYLNIMPRKPDGINGSALIAENAEFSAALKRMVALHQQFLPYFTEGLALGDSMLSEAPGCLVRGFQQDDRILMIVLNIGSAPAQFTLKSDLSLWSAVEVAGYEQRDFDEQGAENGTKHGSESAWTAQTPTLKPLELHLMELKILKRGQAVIAASAK